MCEIQNECYLFTYFYRGWNTLIIILLGALLEEQRDFINKLFSEMNVKMYNISCNILRNKYDAEEAVAQTFLNIVANIEKISVLPCPQIEPYCVIILKNETMNIIRRRKKSVCVDDVDYISLLISVFL